MAVITSCAVITSPTVQAREKVLDAALSPVSALAVPLELEPELDDASVVIESVAFALPLPSVPVDPWQLATASSIEPRTSTPRYEQSGSWSTSDARYGMHSACSSHTSALQSLDDNRVTTKQSEGAEDASSIELMVSISSIEQSPARAAGSSSAARTEQKAAREAVTRISWGCELGLVVGWWLFS
jgi:hypothetical protein